MMRQLIWGRNLRISRKIQKTGLIRCFSQYLPVWTSVQPNELGTSGQPHQLSNLVNGEWKTTEKHWELVCPQSANWLEIVHQNARHAS